jgi:Arc/MetJ-type ribon-helix-helix transcriptional regulator
MAKKRIYTDIVSVRLTENEKVKLETLIQKMKKNKSEFVRDHINQLLETI